MQNLGYHYRLTDIQSALGNFQLENLNKFLEKRKTLAKFYDEKLSNLKNIKILQKNKRDLSANHLYVLLKVTLVKLKFLKLL